MNELPNNPRKSIIWKIETLELQSILDKSFSIAEVLNHLGLQAVNGNNRGTLAKRIEQDNLNLSKLYQNRDQKMEKHRKRFGWGRTLADEELFCKDSKATRGTARRRLLSDALIQYECQICGNMGEHNGEQLSLELDHINGVNNDHRLENLRFLCPNCHSQTKTHAGKKRRA